MNLNNFYTFVNELKKHNPKLNVKFKNESILMKLLGKLLFFNKSFMKTFTTTIGNTIYFPSKEYVSNLSLGSIIVMAHEYRHTQDNKKLGFLYNLIYLFPQILVMFSLLTFVVGWWALLLLIFILPIPAYGRMKLELNGYTMTLFAFNEYYKTSNFSLEHRTSLLLNKANEINKHFTGASYYFMWPFGVEKQLIKNVNLIVTEQILNTDKIFEEVKEAMMRSI